MKKIIRNIDKKLLLFTVLLFVYGLLMVFSSSSVSSFMRYQYSNPASFFIRQAFFLLLGLFGFAIGIKISSKSYGILSWVFTLGFTGVLVLLLIYGTATNDSISWIGYKIFGIQPSEFTKLLIIPLMATYYESKKDKKDDLITMIIPIVLGFIISLLVFLQNDFGTACITITIVVFLFCIANIGSKLKKNILLFGLICVFTIGIFLIFAGKDVLSQEKLERLNFINPCEKFLTSGNQVCNGYIAINNSNGIGKGLGNSTQKYLYLAESHTDFIYAIMVEELGLAGVVVLFSLYIMILARIVIIGRNCYKDSHAMICYGMAFYIFIHILVNLGGVTGLIPLTGVTLPFISYGGSFTLSLIIGLIMVQRIKYETNMHDRRLAKNSK